MSVEPSKIFVTGMTSIHPYAMEYENLGNFVIVEAFFRTLKDEFPASRITTSLQLTDGYCQHAGITVVRDKLFWTYGNRSLLRTHMDFLLVLIWSFLNYFFRIDLKAVRTASPRLREMSNADLILDFHGDMYGDNSGSFRKFLISSMVPLMAKLLGKCICLVASSPGPFNSNLQQQIARFVLNRYDLVATREPFSLYTLNFIGLTGPKFTWYPCPSIGFRPINAMETKELLAAEPKLTADGTPIVGLILCNLNMAEPPLYKWPRQAHEFVHFVRLIEYLVKTLHVRVCVMSHQNKTDRNMQLISGPDHSLVAQLQKLIPEEISDKVFTLQGLYDASTSNRIVSQFEVLVSGRIHGAMQGLSQSIPTAIIDYGMEPKAHKLKGFAMMTGMYNYICDPVSADNMIDVVGQLWRERESVQSRLEACTPKLEQQSRQLWRRVRQEWESSYHVETSPRKGKRS